MGVVRNETTQCLERLFRAIFLDKSNAHDYCDSECNADGVVIVAQEKRDDRGRQEEQDQRLLELFEEPEPQRLRILMSQLIRTVA
jgi:hypothetical protein